MSSSQRHTRLTPFHCKHPVPYHKLSAYTAALVFTPKTTLKILHIKKKQQKNISSIHHHKKKQVKIKNRIFLTEYSIVTVSLDFNILIQEIIYSTINNDTQVLMST